MEKRSSKREREVERQKSIESKQINVFENEN